MRITMIGHSSVLIEMDGKRILTDPFFNRWGNPAYGRLAPPARPREALLDVDLVLVSHDHWDHVDSAFLRRLPGSTPVIVPRRSRWLLKLLGATNPVGLGTWETTRAAGLSVTAVPARHITATAGFVLEHGEERVYFAGDTYYGAFMEEIGRRFRLSAALIPVTTYRIPMTMGESAAVRAVRALNPAAVLPIHLGIAPRSPLLRTGQSPEGFRRRLVAAGSTTPVVVLHEGESWENPA
jgi:L-ascorbate metabolism protein UlaG (beta-lactamase superfamily)